jgi:hypothetical protein
MLLKFVLLPQKQPGARKNFREEEKEVGRSNRRVILGVEQHLRWMDYLCLWVSLTWVKSADRKRIQSSLSPFRALFALNGFGWTEPHSLMNHSVGIECHNSCNNSCNYFLLAIFLIPPGGFWKSYLLAPFHHYFVFKNKLIQICFLHSILISFLYNPQFQLIRILLSRWHRVALLALSDTSFYCSKDKVYGDLDGN